MRQVPGFFNLKNMSHTGFSLAFEKFREKFPPASSLKDSTLQITTEELIKLFVDLNPKWEENVTKEIFLVLEESGYLFEPVEFNERISFKWLIKKSE